MPIAGIALGTGLGGGTTATISGSPGGGGGGAAFNIGAGEPAATIEARSGDAVGYITWATDTFDFYVADGNDNWAITINRPNF